MGIAYNLCMFWVNKRISGRHLVNWLVLWSMVLGQLGMSTSLAFAQTSNDRHGDEPAQAGLSIPVCTSTGIVYVAWPSIDVETTVDPAQLTDAKPSTPSVGTHAGFCVWCTVAAHQLRLDLQRDAVLGPAMAHQVEPYRPDGPVTTTFTGNPHAPPRAPPFI